MINVYNILHETHNGPNNYLICRGASILGNPYTHIKEKSTLASYVVRTRDDAIDRYSHYFDVMYSSNVAFKSLIDEIYTKYCNGEDVWLGCYCHPQRCHGDIIAEKLQRRLLKEKIQNLQLHGKKTV